MGLRYETETVGRDAKGSQLPHVPVGTPSGWARPRSERALVMDAQPRWARPAVGAPPFWACPPVGAQVMHSSRRGTDRSLDDASPHPRHTHFNDIVTCTSALSIPAACQGTGMTGTSTSAGSVAALGVRVSAGRPPGAASGALCGSSLTGGTGRLSFTQCSLRFPSASCKSRRCSHRGGILAPALSRMETSKRTKQTQAYSQRYGRFFVEPH